MKLVRRTGLLVWAAALLAILVIWNLRAYTPVSNPETTLAQLRFLRDALTDGSAEQAQRVFPEGFFFSWVLYGLGNAQLAAQLPASHPERPWLLENAQTALSKLESDAGKAPFPPDLSLPYGAFYNAWVLYLQASLIRALGVTQSPPALLERFQAGCARFAQALERNSSPFLASYLGHSWAADSSIGVGALGLHDKLFPPRFQGAIANWVNRAKALLEPGLGTLPHQSDVISGQSIETSRGGSQAMMVLALAHADPAFAKSQYEAFRKHFVTESLGVPGVLEYVRGQTGNGDVDSGPIVLGFSGPSVIVGMGAAITMNDLHTARVLNGFVETGGFAVQFNQTRRYLFGALPIGDAFLVWIRTMQPLVQDAWPPVFSSFWAWGLHVFSLLLAARIVFGLRQALRGQKIRAAQ